MKTTTNALLLRRVERGEADLVLTFFTETLGVVSALAYSARKSKRRFAGLEVFHTLSIEIDDVAGRDLAVLARATIVTPRLALTNTLIQIEHASEALRWTREMSPPRQPEPALWTALTDALDQIATDDAGEYLAVYGLTMLRVLGVPPVEPVRQGMSTADVLRAVRRTVTSHTAK